MAAQLSLSCGVLFLSQILVISAGSNQLINLFDYPVAVNLLALKTDAPVRTPVVSTLPSLAEIEYYINFVTVVYAKYDTSTSWDCPDCLLTGPNVTLVKVAWNPIANTLALINLNMDTKEIIVTFRGSVNLADYIQNGMLLPIPVSFAGDNGKVRVHGGFYVAADSLFKQIQDTLGQLLAEHQGFRLTFVGHSLGAPLAVLTALRIRSNPVFSQQRFAIFAYGSPRIGNVDFADYVNSLNVTIVRAVNKADLVAHVPARGVQSVYIHHSNQVWVAKNGEINICSTNVYEDPSCSISLGPNYNVLDHTTGYFGTNFIPSITDNWCQFLLQIIIPIPISGICD